jgi:hypothetical protein
MLNAARLYVSLGEPVLFKDRRTTERALPLCRDRPRANRKYGMIRGNIGSHSRRYRIAASLRRLDGDPDALHS